MRFRRSFCWLLYRASSSGCPPRFYLYSFRLMGLRKHFDSTPAVSEPGLQIHCDSCSRDLTHSIRIKCADPVCEVDDGIDICPSCFCAGKEFKSHKRGHAYRVVVSATGIKGKRAFVLTSRRNYTHTQYLLRTGARMSMSPCLERGTSRLLLHQLGNSS